MGKSTMTDVLLERSNNRRLSSFEKQHNDEILLLDAPREDLSILEGIGLDYAINEIKHEKNQLSALTGLEKAYKKPVFLGEDIKKLCNQYDLRLLPVSKFKGKVGSEIISVIKDFQKQSKAEVSLIGYEKFFMLAPEEYFFSDKAIPSIENCTLFYREENRGKAEEDQKFIKVHSWGENYSIFRTIRFLKDSSAHEQDMIYSFSIVGLTLITLMLFIISYIFKSPLLFLVVSLIFWGFKAGNDFINVFDGKMSYMNKWNHKQYKLSDHD